MKSLVIIILAAGLGKRMNSDLPKVLACTRRKPLINHVLDTTVELDPEKVVVVTGHKQELVEEALAGDLARCRQLTFVTQAEQLGTGHAAKCALPALDGFDGQVLILYGDVPLISAATLQRLLSLHQDEKATVSLLSFSTPEQNAYGRVLRDKENNRVSKIVELKDCSPEEACVSEYNSGIYCVDSAFLTPAVEGITNENRQGEYYLTDIVERAVQEGQNVSALFLPTAEEVQGVNSFYELSLINKALMMREIQDLIQSGVIIDDPDSLYIDDQVTIEPGARIGPNVQLRGTSKIASGVVIEGSAFLLNTTVERDAYLKFSVRCEDAVIGQEAMVGPFAHLRPGAVLESKAKVGNFVELKEAVLKEGAKANHLTYLGNCTVGKKSNIGAGTITCNYDGYDKHQTTIGENVFVGSHTCLIAPVTVEDGALIGAGSVIQKDVEQDSLAVGRPELVTKSGWAKRYREKKEKR